MQRSGKRKLTIPLFGILFAILTAIPGAITGVVTGLFGFHLVAAILGGSLFFFLYPWQRQRQGYKTDALSYFNALCGAIGGGLACFYIGQLIR